MAETPCYIRLHVRLRECNRGRCAGYGGVRALLRPAGSSPDGAARARVGVPTRSGAPCAAPSPGAAADPVAALAMAGRIQDRCRGKRARAMTPTAQRTIMVA